MAFDRNDPADLAALQTEVNTDPISMGYNPTGPTVQILQLLNDPDNNVGGETTARTFDAAALLDALQPADLVVQQTDDSAPSYTQVLVAYGQGSLEGNLEPYKARWRALFAGNSATVIALDAQNRPLSRAEVLFGAGTVISRDDWVAARDYTP